METYCDTCKKNTGINNCAVKRTKQNILILESNCVFWGKK